MARPKFTKTERMRLKMEITRLLLEHRSTWEISAALGISHGTLSHYLRQLEAEWRESYLEDMNQKKILDLQRLAVIEEEAWEAWYKSLGTQTETSERVEVPCASAESPGSVIGAQAKSIAQVARLGRAGRTEGTIRKRELMGDPRYLEEIRKCIETRAKIYGYSPQVEVGPDIRKAAERAAEFLGRPVEEVIRRAEEIGARAWPSTQDHG